MTYKKQFLIEIEGEIEKAPEDADLLEELNEFLNTRYGLELWDVTDRGPYDGMTDQEKVVQIAEETNGDVYNHYSDRGMFGKECMGIVHPAPNRVMEEAGKAGLTGAKVDGMGLKSIIYWEKVPPHEDYDE